MDQTKTGKFIAEMRKTQGLTQKQLAERLSVTDKTVSKWETGYRLPDASILLELSAVLRVDINELLAGEKFQSNEFSSEEYIQKTENNIVGLVSELNVIHQKSRSRSIGIIAGVIFVSLSFLYLFAFSLRKGRIIDIFDLPTLFYLLGLKIIILSISGCFHDYLNGWKSCLPQKELSKEDLEPAIQAVEYAGALTITLGCLISFLGFFSLMNYMKEPGLLWPSLAQSVLALLYTAIEKTVYVIMVFRMKRTLRNRQPNR